MTIAQAFNEIAVTQGGTAAKSGGITAAIDALNDALAGSDQPQAKTIEQAVRLLGEHIGGGGGGGTEYNIACYAKGEGQPEPTASFVYKTKVQTEGGVPYFVPDGEPVTTATAGDCLITTTDIAIGAVLSELAEYALAYPIGQTPSPEGGEAAAFIMPSHDVFVLKGQY